MPSRRINAGFTIIELIIVMAIMSLLLAMSAPFVSAARSDIAMNRMVRVLRTDIVTNLGYSLAGKSIAALSSDALLDVEQIPSHYGLYFRREDDYGGGVPYSYLEFRPQEDKGKLRVNYQIDKEWPSSEVYLKEIRLKKGDGSEGKQVHSALILFAAPFGKITLASGMDPLADGDTFNLSEALVNESDYKKVEFVFQYKDDELSDIVLSFGTDKFININ